MLSDTARPVRAFVPDPVERRRSGPVWDSVRHIYVGRPKPYWTVALAAYFDDSRQYSNGLGYHAIAGYLAPTEFWDQEFAPRWKRLIASAPHKISEWKTSDCRGPYGEFQGWKREELNAFTVKVVDEIVSYPHGTMVGFGAVLLFPISGDPRIAKGVEARALSIGLASIVGAICSYAKATRDSEEINFLCDEQKGWEGRLTDVWNEVIRHRDSWYPGKISKLRFDDSREVLPLQAADLLAYEIRKDVIDRVERQKHPRSMALHRLLQGHPHLGVFINEQVLEESKAAWEGNQPRSAPPFLFLTEPLELQGPFPARFVEDPRPPR